jgi:hypothetical protein
VHQAPDVVTWRWIGRPLVCGSVGRVSLVVDGSAGGVDVLGDQSGQFRDQLRRLFVAHPLPPGQRRRRDALGEDFGVVVGVDRVLGAVDDQRWYLNSGEIVDA